MQDRKDIIGGTDISCIMGVNPWKSEYRLYNEKLGIIEPEDLSENEAVEMGIELEETVARMFTKRTGIKVRRSPCRYYHKEHKWMSCQVDYLVTGTNFLLECKTANAYDAKSWEGEDIPIHYILQVQWQLMITGREKGYVAVLIGGQKFRWKEIVANQEIQEKMVNAALEFKDRLINKIPPAPGASDNKEMVKLFPTAGELVKEGEQNLNDAIAMLQQTKAELIHLEKEKDSIEAKIKLIIGDNFGVKTSKYTVTWVNIKGSTFTVTKPDSRQLRVKKNKEE